MRASTKRFVSLLIALLFFALSLAAYFILLKPAFERVVELRAGIAAQSQLLSDQNNAIQKFKNLLTLYNDQFKSLDQTLSSALPTKEEVPSVVNQLQVLGKASSLAVQSLNFKYAPLKLVQAKATKPSLLGKPIGTLDVTLQIAGSYENMKSFLRALETNIRIMDVKSIKLEPVRQGDKILQNLFLYTMEVETYYQ